VSNRRCRRGTTPAVGQKLYEQKEWEKVLREARGPAEQSADFDYYAGMAWSRLERWTEAREAFSIGARKMPRDARFLVERAGAEYKLGTFGAAKRDLRRSLRLNPDDPYAAEFLGIIYLLEGNLEASLKCWHRVGKPRLDAVEVQPAPKTDRQLLDRAVTFAPPGALEPESLLKTKALLENLEVFPQARVELSSTPGGTEGDGYKATLRLNEQSRWGASLLDGAISLLRGLPLPNRVPVVLRFSRGGRELRFAGAMGPGETTSCGEHFFSSLPATSQASPVIFRPA